MRRDSFAPKGPAEPLRGNVLANPMPGASGLHLAVGTLGRTSRVLSAQIAHNYTISS